MVNPLLGWPVILRIIASWNFVTFKISVSSFITLRLLIFAFCQAEQAFCDGTFRIRALDN